MELKNNRADHRRVSSLAPMTAFGLAVSVKFVMFSLVGGKTKGPKHPYQWALDGQRIKINLQLSFLWEGRGGEEFKSP